MLILSCLPSMLIDHYQVFALACENSPAPTRWLDVEGQPPRALPAEPKLHRERPAHHLELLEILDHRRARPTAMPSSLASIGRCCVSLGPCPIA